MKMTFRWYGEEDPVTLADIRQIPGVTGVVSALRKPKNDGKPAGMKKNTGKMR